MIAIPPPTASISNGVNVSNVTGYRRLEYIRGTYNRKFMI
jgi:hypothetical protein